jgi:hypothetical protein
MVGSASNREQVADSPGLSYLSKPYQAAHFDVSSDDKARFRD